MILNIIRRPGFIQKRRPARLFGDWILSSETGTSSVDWAQISRFYLKMEAEYSLRNVVLDDVFG
jgi:hypothetical protein